MELTTVLRVITRILIIMAAALTAAMSQYDDDMAEVKRPRWVVIAVFALFGAAMALIASYGNWFATMMALVATVVSAWFCKGRADNFAGVVVWISIIQTIAPFLANRPFVWTGGETVVAIVAIVSILVMFGFQNWHNKNKYLPPRPYEGEDTGDNPLIIPLAITIVLAFVSIVVLVIA